MPRKAFITVAEAAEIADRSRTQIRNMIKKGVIELGSAYVGQAMVCRKSLDKYIRKIKSGKIKRGNFSLVKKD